MTGLVASGVDTVSFAFRPTSEDVFDALRSRPHRGGAAGSIVCDDRGPDGGRVLAWPGHGLLAVESRLGALLAGDEHDHSLVPATALAVGSTSARVVVCDVLGADPGPLVEVRRFDLAAEIGFDDRSSGLAFLDSLRGVCPARARSDVVVGADGHVQTAYIKTERRGVVLSRVYDKGRESGSDPPGERIRIESQNRPQKAKRYRPDVLASVDLAPIFGRTMSPYLDSKQLVAAGTDGAVAHLVGCAHRGELTLARAERLIGSVAMIKYAGRAAYANPERSAKENNRASARRLKALRDAGISLDHELPAAAVVPTSELLREAITEFTA